MFTNFLHLWLKLILKICQKSGEFRIENNLNIWFPFHLIELKLHKYILNSILKNWKLKYDRRIVTEKCLWGCFIGDEIFYSEYSNIQNTYSNIQKVAHLYELLINSNKLPYVCFSPLGCILYVPLSDFVNWSIYLIFPLSSQTWHWYQFFIRRYWHFKTIFWHSISEKYVRGGNTFWRVSDTSVKPNNMDGKSVRWVSWRSL